MNDLVTPLGNNIKYTECVYESYSDVYAELEDLIKLLTFVDNQDVIQKILSERSSVYNLCVNYINECARKYRKLYTKHCNATIYSDKKYNNLCHGKNTTLGFLQLEGGDAESQIRDAQVSKNEHTILLSSPLKSKITTGVTAGVEACTFLIILYKVNTNYYIYRNITYLIFCL
ncbi:hypothetical protein PCYB_003640 [Plasmodium cynomolgi strain B]|uniref:Uncharacterized protein n=1 Tax=Plasmodium cynomolgi (strain B) TaxID=1120755 RepID=K6V2U2_PLACD|nr:hypothetical protein PCYB_003640 [Plasmodium cynomolgi strain B]GAB69615.1 hypothetical protein PCYB_003640 [Plasmodium cynomolgi strain B]